MVSWYLLFKHIFLMTAISLSLSLFLCFPLCPHTHAQTHARNYICMLLFPGSRWILMSCSGCCVVTVSIMNINLFYLKTLLCCGFIFHKYIMTLPMCCAFLFIQIFNLQVFLGSWGQHQRPRRSASVHPFQLWLNTSQLKTTRSQMSLANLDEDDY